MLGPTLLIFYLLIMQKLNVETKTDKMLFVYIAYLTKYVLRLSNFDTENSTRTP